VILLGIDTGGTFTDFILYKDGSLVTHKVLSTPKAPERAILQGIKELQLDTTDLMIVHGSTVATNALLEGKGVTTAYITNFGLGDVLSIGRQTRSELCFVYLIWVPLSHPITDDFNDLLSSVRGTWLPFYILLHM
jgi:N-methylhydantoinase A